LDAASSIERQRAGERRTWLAAWAFGTFALHSVLFVDYTAGDVIMFVVPWYDYILSQGRIGAFAHPFSNYAPPYLYLLSATSLLDGLMPAYFLVKLLAWVGAAWLVFAADRLFRALGAKPVLAVSLTLLPSVIANVSMLGQADTYWVAPSLLATAAAVRGRWFWVAFWSGLAFAFKAQAAFFAPFVVHLFITRKVPFHIWLVAPAVYLAAMLPAWLVGWPAWDLALVYLRQAMWQPDKPPFYFISNGASWWTIYGWLFPQLALRTFWVGFVLAFAAVGAGLTLVPKLSARTTVMLATISAAGIPFLLPAMHERFYLLADVLAVIYALAYPSRRSIVAAVMMQIASALPVYVWAFQIEPLELLAPPFAAMAIFLFLRELVEPQEASRPRSDDRPQIL
jgi:Gpi18-like mannosyltransferase